MKNLQKLFLFAAFIGTSVSDKLPGYGAEPIGQYGSPLDQYSSNNLLGAASSPIGNYASNGEDPISALQEVIPGVPGEDYPILAEVPETAFSCEGQIEGGYYGDPETECQAFHICAADAEGGLTKYSFLCPNGTIFNQAYFICDWWFNFDCSEAQGLFSKNEEIAAEREAASGLLASGSAPNGYGAPAPKGYGSPARAPRPVPSSKSANGGYGAPKSSSNSYSSPQESANNGYGAPSPSSAGNGYGAPSPSSAGNGYGAPSPSSAGDSYGAPSPSSAGNGYGAPSPSPAGNGYGAPSSAGNGYGAPSPSSAGNSYGAPAASQPSYRF